MGNWCSQLLPSAERKYALKSKASTPQPAPASESLPSWEQRRKNPLDYRDFIFSKQQHQQLIKLPQSIRGQAEMVVEECQVIPNLLVMNLFVTPSYLHCFIILSMTCRIVRFGFWTIRCKSQWTNAETAASSLVLVKVPSFFVTATTV